MGYIDTDKLKSILKAQIKERKEWMRDIDRSDRQDHLWSDLNREDMSILQIINSLEQEEPESSNGKFVFPSALYARTIDNKTIDVSYTPQSLDAVEYIKNDQTEQPDADLKSELAKWMKSGPHKSYPWCTLPDIIKITAAHFYELGKNARK